ncbi:MAG: ABC transporter permease [Saccharofermentanaceae bacterium]|nr:ABC transporter permease [Saccharofermentanaceae bacterium]
MRGLGKIFHHEMQKILKEKTLLFGFLILPVLTLFVTVGISLLQPRTGQEQNSSYVMYFYGIDMEKTNIGSVDEKQIWVENIDVAPEEFIQSDKFHKCDVLVDFSDIECVEIYYHQSDSVSTYLKMSAESFVRQSFDQVYKRMESDVVFRSVEVKDITLKENNNRMIAMLLPYMLILPLTANIANFAGDTVAGDKARGTFYQVMLSPVPPISLIMGKILSVSLISLFSSGLYIGIDVIGSKICEAMHTKDVFGFAGVSVTVPQVLLILLYAVLLCYLFSNLGVLISLFCKDASQAQTAQLPVTLACTIASMMSMFRLGTSPASHYLIPVYNICLIFQDLLNGRAKMENMVMVAVSLLVLAVLVLITTLLSYKSEKVRT